MFIHIPKCGGSSIEKALLIAENVEFDRLRFNLPNGLTTLPRGVNEEYGLVRDGAQHCFLNEYPPYCQENYFSFTFVRNPWDLLVSKYHYFDLRGQGISFKKMILSMDKVKLRGRHHLSINQGDFIDDTDCDFDPSDVIKTYPIDYIGRFENLQGDFDTVCEKIGIPHQKLEKINATEHRPYWEYYDDETRDIVATKYEKDIKTFGYKWEPILGF
jgi:hypothetical protein